MYTVAIKQSAFDHNPHVHERVAEPETIREFESQNTAERFVADCCAAGPTVRLQSPAPQDSDDIDAYLVKDEQTNEWEPIETSSAGTTFPVGANVYGSIALGIVYCDGKASPALSQYFAEQAPVSKQGRVTKVILQPRLPDDLPSSIGWRPDLLLEVSSDPFGATDTYFVEVKGGDASFERNQRGNMQTVAEQYGVLAIRVRIDRLPEQYTTQIHEARPNDWHAE